MSLWIKICANTSLEDAQLAVDAGTDALGFVFAPSPRRITANQVAAITPHLPPSIEKIGVFVEADLDEIASTIRAASLTGVQLHSQAGPDAPAQLRALFGSALRILRVVHFGPDAGGQAQSCAADPNLDGILIDSRTTTAVGGTGISFDWNEARRTVFGGATAARLVAAGGLNPGNVAQAIATLQPWGVDVASGVEATPGRKDPLKVRAFVLNARAAADAPPSELQQQ